MRRSSGRFGSPPGLDAGEPAASLASALFGDVDHRSDRWARVAIGVSRARRRLLVRHPGHRRRRVAHRGPRPTATSSASSSSAYSAGIPVRDPDHRSGDPRSSRITSAGRSATASDGGADDGRQSRPRCLRSSRDAVASGARSTAATAPLTTMRGLVRCDRQPLQRVLPGARRARDPDARDDQLLSTG